MGKLGNNLKSTIIVLVAVLAAFAALPFAANFFGVKSQGKNDGGNNDMEANAAVNSSYFSVQPRVVNSSIYYLGEGGHEYNFFHGTTKDTE